MDRGDFEACPEPPEPFVSVLEDGFGFLDNDDGSRDIVRRFTFSNQNSLIIQVITYGATITTVKFPDKDGFLDDIVLGFDDLEGYLSPSNPYFGATIGRCANRITKGHFKIGNEDFQLSTNLGDHHNNGGFKGFDKVNWKCDLQNKKVVMTYLSKDGEEGYPGEVLACVSFEMTTDNEFIIEMKATSSRPTPINMTNHSYFNLAGHSKGVQGLYEHVVSINADKYCHTDEEHIPSGMLKNVVNTLWDLRIGKSLGKILPHVPYGGYDQNMCIHKTTSECLTFVARVVHPGTQRTLEVYSNQPGVQFYTANALPSKPLAINDRIMTGLDMDVMPGDGCSVRRCPLCGQIIRDPDFENIQDDEVCSGEEGVEDNVVRHTFKIIGKDYAEYYKHAGFCLMTQKYPDSVHRKNFPNSIIRPGESYFHLLKYKFDLFEEALALPDEDDEIIDDTEVEEKVGEEQESDDLLETKLEENGR